MSQTTSRNTIESDRERRRSLLGGHNSEVAAEQRGETNRKVSCFVKTQLGLSPQSNHKPNRYTEPKNTSNYTKRNKPKHTKYMT